jgi:tetratricopeptide (TPR) repeat protein
MERFKEIDSLIIEGSELATKGDSIKSCDIWLKAWDLINEIFTEGIAKDIEDLDKKYKWSQWLIDYTQNLEMELDSAGSEDSSYYRKRIEFCREFLQWCGTDELLIGNARIAIAESYYEIGEEAVGEKLFEEWLREDPDWGWGYVGWFESCLYRTGLKRYDKAEEILLTGYARSGLRSREHLLERLIVLYTEMGNAEKAKEYDKEFKELKQAKSVKVGRNEPCPCGSGKKYKKCCLP